MLITCSIMVDLAGRKAIENTPTIRLSPGDSFLVFCPRTARMVPVIALCGTVLEPASGGWADDEINKHDRENIEAGTYSSKAGTETSPSAN